jgi:uncharacterized protein (DUF2237 family)
VHRKADEGGIPGRISTEENAARCVPGRREAVRDLANTPLGAQLVVCLRLGQTGAVRGELNVLGDELQSCGLDPVTGFYREGDCASGPNTARHLVCAVMTAEFLSHQREVGNDLSTPMPAYGFPGLQPGDRWCVVLERWVQAYADGLAPPVVLASTNARALEVIDLATLQQHAVDVPDDIRSLD